MSAISRCLAVAALAVQVLAVIDNADNRPACSVFDKGYQTLGALPVSGLPNGAYLVTATHCQTMCNTIGHRWYCNYWTWNRTDGSCWLANRTGFEMETLPGMVSGPADCATGGAGAVTADVEASAFVPTEAPAPTVTVHVHHEGHENANHEHIVKDHEKAGVAAWVWWVVAAAVAALIAAAIVFFVCCQTKSKKSKRDVKKGAKDETELPLVQPQQDAFSRIDANHDGVIDAAEWSAAVPVTTSYQYVSQPVFTSVPQVTSVAQVSSPQVSVAAPIVTAVVPASEYAASVGTQQYVQYAQAAPVVTSGYVQAAPVATGYAQQVATSGYAQQVVTSSGYTTVPQGHY